VVITSFVAGFTTSRVSKLSESNHRPAEYICDLMSDLFLRTSAIYELLEEIHIKM
jgi:hypothetical protein